MKSNLTFLFLIVLFSLFSKHIYSQNKNTFVKLSASALVNDKAVSNYSILVYENGILKDSVFVKKTKPLSIPLEANKLYSIVFKKENCASKFVIVNTQAPSYLSELEQEPFELQIEISATVSSLKKEFDDYPVAVLYVNTTKKLLMASENYFKLTRG